MSLLRINTRPSNRQLLIFALAWLVVAATAGAAQLAHHHRIAAVVCWSVSLAVPLAGAIWKEGLRCFYVALCYATYPIGYVISSAVLVVFYYGVLTPVGLLLRLCGHDALQRRERSRRESYWQPRPPERPAETYFKQY